MTTGNTNTAQQPDEPDGPRVTPLAWGGSALHLPARWRARGAPRAPQVIQALATPRGRGVELTGEAQMNLGGGMIQTDPEILGGTPVFAGTRVPIQNLFDCL